MWVIGVDLSQGLANRNDLQSAVAILNQVIDFGIQQETKNQYKYTINIHLIWPVWIPPVMMQKKPFWTRDMLKQSATSMYYFLCFPNDPLMPCERQWTPCIPTCTKLTA